LATALKIILRAPQKILGPMRVKIAEWRGDSAA
jgi:hypothetical protein